ncbi:ribosome silencing factor [Blattabacterium cuenoti]|uniref:ribosome silencing factor n=1 Tax=Blattabacterium cuenoti TaxID=1653831 RepID=UPI00163CA03F|nr:ribosome silencing factor [Blattabacterium cuenoti]
MLLKIILKGIQIVKGENISILNIKNKNFICDYFIICNGKSKNQVYAIFQSIEKITKNKLNEKPWHKEGLKNREWILLDYISIVVHIFQEKTRLYYDIDNFWKEKTIDN